VKQSRSYCLEIFEKHDLPHDVEKFLKCGTLCKRRLICRRFEES